MELEHHKEEHGHWSDEEEESDEEEMDDLNGNQQVNLVYEEETIFGPEVEKRILLCSQDWLHFLNKSLQTRTPGTWVFLWHEMNQFNFDEWSESRLDYQVE